MPCSGCSALHGVNPNLRKIYATYTAGGTFDLFKLSCVFDSFAVQGSFCYSNRSIVTKHLVVLIVYTCIFNKYCKKYCIYLKINKFTNKKSIAYLQ